MNKIDVDEIRKRVEQRFIKRTEFAMHAAAFIFINLALIVLWVFTNGLVGFPWFLIVLFSWGAGLVVHGMDVFFNTYYWVEARERAIQREIDLVRGQLDIQKRKRMLEESDGKIVRLSTDGELEEDSFFSSAK